MHEHTVATMADGTKFTIPVLTPAQRNRILYGAVTPKENTK